MVIRMLIVALCLGGASAVLAKATESEVVPARAPLEDFPMDIAAWRGIRAPDFDEAIRAELGVDEYLNASYRMPAVSPVGLYIGYYATQRQGDTMHSPANCLPGAGWQPIESGQRRITVPSTKVGADIVPGREIDVTRWVIQKGEEQQLVYYWYQSHGRVVPGEYWNKVYLVLDAIRLNRTDGALVRVITPMTSSSPGRRSAEEAAISFVKSMFPLLGRFLPA